MRQTILRSVLGLIGIAAILFGMPALLGRRPLGDQLTRTVIALGAVLNGAVVTKKAFTRSRAIEQALGTGGTG